MTPTTAHRVAGTLAGTVLLAACAGRQPPPVTLSPGAPVPTESTAPSPALPPVAPVRGPLALRVAYPPPETVLQVRDSSFFFGTAGSGDARVTIDGQPA